MSLFQPSPESFVSASRDPPWRPSTYVYTPLLPGEIRLMTMLPGKAGEPIHCEISTTTLLSDLNPAQIAWETTPFEALSYMWITGDGLGDFVHIGEARLFARGNLLQALHRLRYEDKPRVLWIDAICIDQASIPERNDQVSRMRYIYRQASTVLVWIFEDFVNEDSEVRKRSCLGQALDMSIPSYTETFDKNPAPVFKLYCAPYWSRLWIIQEMLSAQKIVLHCGPLHCEWQELVDSLTAAADQQKYATHAPSITQTPIWALVKTLRAKETLTLRQLLLRHGHSQCQDPRDRIYGLIGLASDCQDGEIPIDYAIDVEELFERVVALYAHCKDSDMRRFVFHLRNILL